VAQVDLRKKLKEAGKLWKGAKKKAAEKSSAFVEYEDGRYMARLQGGEIGTSEAGRLQLAWSWKFEDEPYEGKIKKAYQGLENEDNLVFLARDLERLGYEAPDDIAGIEEVLNDIKKEKPLARIRLKSKGDFQNVYIDKVFSGDEEDEAEEEDTEETETETETEEAETEEESDEEESDDAEESDEEESDEEETEEESDEESDEEDDEVELTVGMRVEADTSKGKKVGKIIEILEKENKVRVKTEEGPVVKVGIDKLAAADEPEEAPKKKAKDEPAPVKKKKDEPAPAPPPVVKKKVKK
jgi:hypothetical protein